MPLYEVEHCIPLSKFQRSQIAREITHIHTRKFTTPSLFVNVRFTDVSGDSMYVAGEEVSLVFFYFILLWDLSVSNIKQMIYSTS